MNDIRSPVPEKAYPIRSRAKIVKTNFCICVCCNIGTAPSEKGVIREDGKALHKNCFMENCVEAGIEPIPAVTSISQAERFIEKSAQKLMYSPSKREQEILWNLSLFYRKLTGVSLEFSGLALTAK